MHRVGMARMRHPTAYALAHDLRVRRRVAGRPCAPHCIQAGAKTGDVGSMQAPPPTVQQFKTKKYRWTLTRKNTRFSRVQFQAPANQILRYLPLPCGQLRWLVGKDGKIINVTQIGDAQYFLYSVVKAI